MPIALAITAMASFAHVPAPHAEMEGPFRHPIAAVEMASIRGSYLPTVGIDLAAAASNAVTIPVLLPQLSSISTREVVDNWNVDVSAPLIATAIAISTGRP